MLVLLEEADCPVATSPSPWDRLMARVQASRLDSDLAGGASPDATAALALRAQSLISPRTRREMAKGAQRLLATAMQAPANGGSREAAADRLRVPAAARLRVPAAARLRVPATARLRVPAAARLRLPAARPTVPICGDRVRESAEEFGALIRRLLADAPVAARGVALASALLSDGSGPIYHRANADDVRARVREAVDALDPLDQATVG
jgi:hypothetical protein